ncbi:hypothetical protein VDGD_20397 [Verticillium dahliae]|nr:hypothetical protein VdG1_06301 [Verticillium dahliae VDG1]RBQ92669.1 hypothetical protein VDGD_20397 [Verticillium dahliae]
MNTVVIAPLDSMVIRPGSEFVTLFARTVNLALGFQRLLGAVWLSVIPRTYFLAAYTAATALFASRIIATHSLALTKSIVLGSAKACNIVWKSKRVRRICKQMEYDFAMVILGPGVNTLIVLVFWPGWWVLCGAAVAAKLLFG